MAVPAFRAVGTTVFAPNNIANPTALAPTKSGSTVNGDLMVLWTWCRSITATVGTPTGWNLVTGFPKRSGTASGGSIYCFTRIADGAANDAPTATWTGVTTGTSGDASGAVIESISNATETLDVSAVASSDLAAQAGTTSIPDVTTLHDQAIAVCLAVKLLESSGQNGAIGNYTERIDSSTTSGTGHIAIGGTKVVASAAAVGASTVSWSATGSARALAVSLAFRNAPTTVTLTPATETSAPITGYWPSATVGLLGVGTAGSGATSGSPVAPAGLMVGDVMVLAYSSIRGSPQHTPAISGGANGTWTQLHYAVGGALGTSKTGAVYAKVVESADIGATFTIDGPNFNATNNVVYAAIMGINKLNAVTLARAIDASSTGGELTGVNSNDHAYSAITPAFANDLITMIGTMANFNGDTYTMTDPAVLTEQHDAGVATGDGGHVSIATALKTTAGSTGAGTFHTVTSLPVIMKYVAAWLSIPFIDKTLTLTTVTQASSAIAQSFNKALDLTTAAETDSAIALIYALDTAHALTAVTEASTAVALSYYKAVTITPAGETTTATAETAQKTLSVSTATETDTAEAVTGYKAVTVSTATETDSTVAITFTKDIYKDVTTATESDTATAQTTSKAVDITTASETDSAQAVTFYRTVDLTPVSESDTAVAVTGYKTLDITPTGETDAAQAVTFTKDIHKDVTQVNETDIATSLQLAGGPIPIDPVFETDTPVALVFTKDILVSLTPVAETDTAQALAAAKEYTLGVIAETDTTVPLTIAADIIKNLTLVNESDLATTLSIAGAIDSAHSPDEGHATDGVRSGGVAYPKRGMVF